MNVQTTCRICGATSAGSLGVREMMFGMRDEFAYDECATCGCVQLRVPPADPARYYPGDYYSLQPASARGRLFSAVRRARNRIAYRNPLGLARAIAGILPKFPLHTVQWFRLTGTHPQSRILDVGSGIGHLVRDLGEAGFTNVLGIDPYLEAPIEYLPGVRVARASVHEATGEHDLVMFHHSLEHVPDQLETLLRARKLMAPEGWCIIRIPVTSSYAFRHYRENWVQLDAPRHYVLHSVESLRRLAAAAGLRVDHVIHDSTALQFWGSEAYRRDVPLGEARRLFSRQEMREFERRARALNARSEGDQACFYLRRA